MERIEEAFEQMRKSIADIREDGKNIRVLWDDEIIIMSTTGFKTRIRPDTIMQKDIDILNSFLERQEDPEEYLKMETENEGDDEK